MLLISSLSTEYVTSAVSVTVAGTAYDPTGDPVDWAFTQDVSEEPTSWTAGSWETSAKANTYLARVLIGPAGDLVLADGLYYAWVRITDNPEVPVRLVGQVRIT